MVVKRCISWHRYHDPKIVDTRRTGDGATEKIHFCPICQTEWIIKHLPDGSVMQDDIFCQIYAKDFLQPYHADYELIYGRQTTKKQIEDFTKKQKVDKSLEIKREELQDYKQHISKGKVHMAV